MSNISFNSKYVVLIFLMLSLQSNAQTCHTVVAKDTSGNFKTISEAINAIPESCAQGYVIKIRRGFYEESVVVPRNKPNVRLIGDGMSRTVVSARKNGPGGYGTDTSGTLSILGNGFTAVDMTIQNVANPNEGPACAIVIEADHLSFFRCQFIGYQDTIFTKSGRVFFRDCEVQGSIDFICGDGLVVFQNSKIAVRKPLPHHFSTITAQKRDSEASNTGTVLQNCSIVPNPDFQSTNYEQIFLGRPWGKFSRTVVMTSYLHSFIEPSGWAKWSSVASCYYAEYSNYGPGADTTKRVGWSKVIPDTEAEYFTVKNFLQGDTWIPNIIPFNSGL